MGWFSEETFCEDIYWGSKVREKWCGQFSSRATSAHLVNYTSRYLAEIYQLVRHKLSCAWVLEVPIVSNLLLCFERAWTSLLVCMSCFRTAVYCVFVACSIGNNQNMATEIPNRWLPYLTTISRNHHKYTVLTTQIPTLMHKWEKSSCILNKVFTTYMSCK